MAFLPTTTITLAGATLSYIAADVAGDTFTPSDRTYFHIKNDSGGSVTALFEDPNSISPPEATTFDPDVTVVVAPATEVVVGPFSPSRFADTDGYMSVSYDTVTSISVVVCKVVVPSL